MAADPALRRRSRAGFLNVAEALDVELFSFVLKAVRKSVIRFEQGLALDSEMAAACTRSSLAALHDGVSQLVFQQVYGIPARAV